MESKQLIFAKLESFIKKYYTNELLRGSLFFIGLGLFYFLFTSFIEYFLWLQPTGRSILFWLFIIVEFFLLIRFIAIPLFKLFRLQKGLSYEEASFIIGKHFNEVNDKLVNFLQLTNDINQSELLLASIDQKAKGLQPIPFSNAIDLNKNKKYIPLALIPFLIILFFMISGKEEYLAQGIHRVINYNKHFSPPAPFELYIKDSLVTQQNKDFTLTVFSKGKINPDKAVIVIGNEQYFMENTAPGIFQYTFENPLANTQFYIQSNEVISKNYNLKVEAVPAITHFEMLLNYPDYLGKKNELIRGTGNAVIPEGTTITWGIRAQSTESILMNMNKSLNSFNLRNNNFVLTKKINQNSEYQIVTSNKAIKNFEKLTYSLNIIKDQYPTIKIESTPDSLRISKPYLIGQIADDYGFHNLSIVYFPKDKTHQAKRGTLSFKQGVYDKFIFSFPGSLPIQTGIEYDYYFEISDNDVLHGFKTARTSVFSHRESTEQEKQEEFLQRQNDNINSLSKTLKSQDKQQTELEKLQQVGKEKKELNYKEQQKINDFIKRQKQEEELLKKYAEKIKENLDQFKPTSKDPKKEELEKRLDNVQQDLEKNKKLLDELKELNEKMQHEDLFDKIEKFQQKSKNQSKSLEQLVELTKRYYIEQKAKQLVDKLAKLADKQEDLSNSKENNEKEQNELNTSFDRIQNELNSLEKENKELKKPLSIPSDEEKQKSIDSDMKNASNELKNKNNSKAIAKQKSATRKMRQMAQSMEKDMQGGDKEQINEDIKMLRQIVDNLLEFSFSEERLMNNFKSMNGSSSSFSKHIKTQQDLKNQFKHVDDSLFAMSLRNPKIGEKVTKEVGNIYYNIDKSIDYFTDNQVARGISSQQYTFASANTLANLLADVLNNMQMSMSASGSGQGSPSPGKGKGSGMQLPDIIMRQEELAKKMSKGNSQKPSSSGTSGSGEGKESGGNKSNNQGGSDSKDGKGKQNTTGENGEGNAQSIIDILKQQQQLRDALEKELNKQGLGTQGQNVLDQMKQLEKQLVTKGFNQQLVQKALNLKYELLKLQEAAQQQNQDSKREGTTNKKEFQNTSSSLPQNLQEYLNSIEILNRQSLPLRSQFNKRIQEYFKQNDKL
ncbi:hypothetical protein FLACOL_00327 [Flavobacterium columnare]|uniref:DUF4175 family protein n=2 Tax=Flavobacterium TaxID=237 RepID=A0ABW8PNV2_9FLAO|nr:DUF4175 family protein [Flavobacterium columnare]SPE76348.1 hypothetical protein FLACOL_00327 [Flavobacterium columnare]